MSVIVGFYENAIFCEINEFLENSKKASSTNSGYKKMANLGDRGKSRQKWGFLFCMNNSLTWAVKWEKLNFRKS